MGGEEHRSEWPGPLCLSVFVFSVVLSRGCETFVLGCTDKTRRVATRAGGTACVVKGDGTYQAAAKGDGICSNWLAEWLSG